MLHWKLGRNPLKIDSKRPRLWQITFLFTAFSRVNYSFLQGKRPSSTRQIDTFYFLKGNFLQNKKHFQVQNKIMLAVFFSSFLPFLT